MKCKTCRFFDPRTGTSYGLCRHDTPVIGDDGETGVWPEVHIDAWCGEYEPQPDPESGAVSGAMREWRTSKGYDDPEFPYGEFGKPLQDDTPNIPSDADEYYERLAEQRAEDAMEARYLRIDDR